MSLMRIQARLACDSGLPEDDFINTWHFDSDQTFGEDADDTCDRLTVFYGAIGAYLSNNLTGGIDGALGVVDDGPGRKRPDVHPASEPCRINAGHGSGLERQANRQFRRECLSARC